MSRNLQNTGRFFLLKARNCCFRKAAESLERAWGELSLRPVEYGARGPGAWCPFGWLLVRGAPFRARFWCAVRRFWARFWFAMCAPILGSILVCCAPFLGSILVRGVWCADFGVDFGVRCAVFWTRFWCAVCGAPILRPILVQVCGAPFFGLDFGARCVVRRFWGQF